MRIQKVTIITPSFNQGSFLEETIESVINQTYKNIEYIIIDGGSTDNSVEILKKYNDYISYWESKKDKGQSHAINKGIVLATGDLLCWINSDDVLLPWAVESMVNFFNLNPMFSIANGYTIRIDERSNIIFNYFIPKHQKLYAKLGIWFMSQQSLFWKKSLSNELGLLREDFHARMDQEFVARALFNNYKFGLIKKPIGAIRIHKDTKTASAGEIWKKDLQKLQQIYSPKFTFKRNFLGSFIYRFHKIFNGNYFNQILFKIKYHNNHLSVLIRNYNKYLTNEK